MPSALHNQPINITKRGEIKMLVAPVGATVVVEADVGVGFASLGAAFSNAQVVQLVGPCTIRFSFTAGAVGYTL